MTQNKNLQPDQNEAVTCLLEQGTVTQAATEAIVSRSTIYRWLRQSDFQAALRAGEGIILDKAARRLIGLAGKAIEALASVIDEPTQEGATQKRYAAQAILDNVLKLWELRNIEARVALLERDVTYV